MFDTLLLGGTVYDGLGSEGIRTDIGIRADRIEAIGDLRGYLARDTLLCDGLSILPGFIDAHTHSDLYLLADRGHPRAALQGVTTEIVGPCGLGVYPLPEDAFDEYCSYLEGLLGRAPKDARFYSLRAYLSVASGCAVNVAAQVSHGALRMCAAGFVDTPLDGERLRATEQTMEAAIEEGAVAFSTGLSYYPATYATDEEVISIARMAARGGLPLAAHCRTVFPDGCYNMETRYEEFLDIARQADCAVHFSHTKHPKSLAGNPQAFLDPFENAIAEGLRVSMEFYPYPSGAGFAPIFLPGWALDGGYQAALTRIRQKKLRKDLLVAFAGMREQIAVGIIGYARRHPELVGKTFAQVAETRGESCEESLLWLLDEESLALGYRANTPIDPSTLAVYERDYAYLLTKPYYILGSDSEPAHMLAHPRTSGTFPRMARLARESHMPLSVFAKAAAARAARIFGLKGRGILRAGAYADIAIINADTIAESCTYDAPDAPPIGVEHVFVNGQCTVRGARTTGRLPGRSLRREACEEVQG